MNVPSWATWQSQSAEWFCAHLRISKVVSCGFSPLTNRIRSDELKEKNMVSENNFFLFVCLFTGREGCLHSSHCFSSGSLLPSKLPNAIRAVSAAFECFIAGHSRYMETQRLMPCSHQKALLSVFN